MSVGEAAAMVVCSSYRIEVAQQKTILKMCTGGDNIDSQLGEILMSQEDCKVPGYNPVVQTVTWVPWRNHNTAHGMLKFYYDTN